MAELNASRPDFVADIHREYVAAGARLVETNTFAANALKLSSYGLENRVTELNELGAKLARAAVPDEVFVAGSVGPLGAMMKPFGYLTPEEAKGIFREQMEGLLAGGVDLVAIETMSSVAEAGVALNAWRELTDLPALCSLTFLPEGTTKLGDEIATSFRELVNLGADVVGLNCNLGPKETYDLVANVLLADDFAREKWFLSVMPNAGYPGRAAPDRLTYVTSPEYFGEYAQLFAAAGANIIGGCCGTTPAHVAAIAKAVAEFQPSPRTVVSVKKVPVRAAAPTAPPAAPRRRFANKLGKEFVVTVEIDPPRGTDFGQAVEGAALLKSLGVDAVNVADNPLARVRMSGVALAHIIHERVGLEPILHFTCRDRNIIGLQSELLGAAALGINTILALTGDPSEVGDYPKAKAVFDLDSTGLVELVHKLRGGTDLTGKSWGQPFDMTVGVALNLGAPDINRERNRLQEKISAGANFAVTQPIYVPDLWLNFLSRFGAPGIPVLVGILPFASFRHAQFLRYEVPGIAVPDETLERMRAAAERGPEAETAEGVAIAREIIAAVRDSCQGICVMPPFGKYELVREVLT